MTAVSNAPRVSVVMAVYNGEKYLREAVDSILAQTFADFEFIIIDDGSTDGTARILAEYRDPRIVKIENETNLGISISLNRGLELCRGKYIARMDADDISNIHRFACQVDYLERNPDIAVLGTGMTIINEDGVITGWQDFHCDSNVTAWAMLHWCSVAHPSVMMSKEFVLRLGGYNPDFRHAEDYDLWTRIIQAGGRISVIPKRLLLYRQNASQFTANHYETIIRVSLDISYRYISWLLNEVVRRELVEETVNLLNAGRVCDQKKVFSCIMLIHKMLEQHRKRFDDGTGALVSHISDTIESKAKIAYTAGALKQSVLCFAYSLYLKPDKLIRLKTYRPLIKALVRGRPAPEL